MERRCLACFILIFTVLSCNRHVEVDESSQNNFHDVQQLSYADTLIVSKVHRLENQLTVANPFEIVNLSDSFLIISEFRTEQFINVFELPSLNYLYSFGEVGQGPGVGEFSSMPVFMNTGHQQLSIYNGISRTLRYLEIDNEGPHKVVDKELFYDGQLEPLSRVRRVNEHLYVSDYGTSIEQTDREFIAIEPDRTNSLFTFGQYPENEFGRYPEDMVAGIQRYHQFEKRVLSNPEGTKLAAFYLRRNKFKIFNDRGEELVAVNIIDPDTERDRSDNAFYRKTGWASNNFLYTLGLNSTSSNSQDASLEVWTWDGQPVFRAPFDRAITSFTISEKHQKVYALSGDQGEEILEYSLPRSLFDD